MYKHPGQAGVEVTEEMVSAGAIAFLSFDAAEDRPEHAAVGIYAAMEEARIRSGGAVSLDRPEPS